MNQIFIEYGPVQVFDDRLPEPLFHALLQAAGRIGWRFGWNTPSNPHSRYWHHEVGFGDKNNTTDVSAMVRQQPLAAFVDYMDWLRNHLVAPDTRVLRFYLNAHTYGTDGWPHTDTDRGEEITTVLYLAPPWQPAWCGETVVFDANGDIEAAVLPRPNRLLSFPSNRLHSPRPLSKAFEGLRVVLVVKLGAPDGRGASFSRSPVATSTI
jgi:SM-20-related protein